MKWKEKLIPRLYIFENLYKEFQVNLSFNTFWPGWTYLSLLLISYLAGLYFFLPLFLMNGKISLLPISWTVFWTCQWFSFRNSPAVTPQFWYPAYLILVRLKFHPYNRTSPRTFGNNCWYRFHQFFLVLGTVVLSCLGSRDFSNENLISPIVIGNTGVLVCHNLLLDDTIT